MKINKDTQIAARRLLRLCMEGGSLVEDRVSQVTGKILARKPRNYVALLAAFSRMAALAIKKKTARIQSAIDLSEEEKNAIRTKLVGKYGEGLYFHWETRPELIGGIRVQVGDDVKDGSVSSRIARLSYTSRLFPTLFK